MTSEAEETVYPRTPKRRELRDFKEHKVALKYYETEWDISCLASQGKLSKT